MTAEPRLPTNRADVEAHCLATIPGFADLDPDVRDRTIAYLRYIAVELNERVDTWNELPLDPFGP